MYKNIIEAKRKLIKKFGAFCFYCGDPLGNYWERDHIIPKSKGGKDRARMIFILKRFKQIKTPGEAKKKI